MNHYHAYKPYDLVIDHSSMERNLMASLVRDPLRGTRRVHNSIILHHHSLEHDARSVSFMHMTRSSVFRILVHVAPSFVYGTTDRL